jgi:hypothetical protein
LRGARKIPTLSGFSFNSANAFFQTPRVIKPGSTTKIFTSPPQFEIQFTKNPTMNMHHTDTIKSLATDRFLEQIGLINLESSAAIEIADTNSDSSAAFERAVARLKDEGCLFAANLRDRLSRGYRLPPLAIVNAVEETEQAERSA